MRIQNIARKFARATMSCAACMALPLAAQEYPSKPLRLISPFSAGGGADTVARFFGQKLAATLQQQVVVDNRAGAGSIIGTDLAAKSPPDGYTILIVNDTHAINANLFRKLPYDPIRDFAPITMIAATPFLLLVHPSLPVKTAQDLVKLAKSKPGQINYASSGNGSVAHFAGEFFKINAGVDIVHIPYRGITQAVIDVTSGAALMMIVSPLSALPLARAGKLRLLAVTSAKRIALLPDAPTVAESGFAGFDFGSWNGIMVPAKTPREINARIYNATISTLKNPTVVKRMSELGYVIVGNTPEQFAAVLKSENDIYGPVIRKAGIKID